MTTTNGDAGATQGDATQEAPATGAAAATATTGSTTATDTTNPAGATPSDESTESETDWEARYRGQLEVNRKLEKRAKENADAAIELEQLKVAGLTDQEKAVADARVEGERTATSKAQLALFGAELRAAIAGKVADPTLFSDPGVALGLLQLNAPPVDEATGLVDTDALGLALDELLKRSPILAAGTRASAGSADSGGRTGGGAHQLTREDAKRMSADEIVAAKAAGQFDKLLGRT